MAPFIVVYDACVLYPITLCGFLMYLAQMGTHFNLFRAHWTEDIHDEWMRNVLIDRPDLTVAQLQRRRQMMDANVPEALITDYRSLIPTVADVNEKDRHVVAAAIRAGASVIVTTNLKDFPPEALRPHRVEAQHPDEFVCHLLDLHAEAVCTAARLQRASYRNPPFGEAEYLSTLRKLGLRKTVAELKKRRCSV